MGKEQEVMIGICGGVGPASGLLLHQLILEHTEHHGEDQGHFNICHFSRSQDVSDRSTFLHYQENPTFIDNSVENPAYGMARTFEMMHLIASSNNIRLVAGVPCNTFHASPIWDEFKRLTKPNPNRNKIQLVHMLKETAKFIMQHAASCTRIGLMSTTGTRESRVFHDLLEPLCFTIIEVNPELQTEVQESIYNKTWGIKSTAPSVTPRCKDNFIRYASILRENGAEVIVLGCTEIPFAFIGKSHFAGVLLIDPLVALARALIRKANPCRLKPLSVHVMHSPASRITSCASI